MSRLGSPGRAAFGLVVVIVAGCGPREEDARKHLEAEGYAVRSVAQDGKSFAWVATKGDQVCKGTLVIAKGLGSTSHTNTSSCERDTSACKPEAPAACIAIADELYAKEEKVFPTKAAELYRVACEAGKGDACARVAEFEKIDKKWDLVREFAKKGCDLRSGEGCRRLAATELEGQGTTKDEARALELMKTACDLGSLGGCRGAAGILYDGGKPADAIGFGERLCAAKWEDGCFVLGLALHAAKKDLGRAATLLQAVCADAKLDKDKRDVACKTAGGATR